MLWNHSYFKKVKTLPYGVLPIGVDFWRRGQEHRWIKNEDGSAFNTRGGVPPEDIANDEIVLSDPNWCSECWTHLRWPLPSRCPKCGRPLDHLDKIESMITDWTGNQNPHI